MPTWAPVDNPDDCSVEGCPSAPVSVAARVPVVEGEGPDVPSELSAVLVVLVPLEVSESVVLLLAVLVADGVEVLSGVLTI
jgi:hypothetical protein